MQCVSLRETAKERARVSIAAAQKIENVWCSYRSRCEARIMTELHQRRLKVWYTAAMKIQACVRRWYCRSAIASRKLEQNKRCSSACQLQAYWRGYRQRMVYAIQLQRYRIIQEESAALQLQSTWRRYKVIIIIASIPSIWCLPTSLFISYLLCLSLSLSLYIYIYIYIYLLIMYFYPNFYSLIL